MRSLLETVSPRTIKKKKKKLFEGSLSHRYSEGACGAEKVLGNGESLRRGRDL